MPRILVTNDDGIYSEGLAKLAEAVRPLGDVVIVAPDREQSAASHALTLNRPLRLQEISEDRWIVDGTPTDCVNLALLHLFRDKRPDLVISGINFGPNMGDDVTYSGTISAAFEGSLLNVPSIAFSAFIGEHFDFAPCAAFAAKLVAEALELHRDPRIILNVNFPDPPFGGVRVTKLGRREYVVGVIERLDPRGRKYYWIGGEPPVWYEGEGTDIEAVMKGLVSITPLHLDMTHHPSIASLRSIEERLGDAAREA
ncbi:MAG: 5'/3'-nucleotidase SurE [Thermoanaerobaculia bacterium]